MFYENLKTVCEIKGYKITPLILECGGTKGILSGWKNGKYPNSEIVIKLAEKLETTTDFLLTGKKNNGLKEDEKQLLNEYEKLSDIKKGRLIQFAYNLQENDIIEETEEHSKIEYKNFIDKDFYIETVSAGTGIYLTGSEKVKIQIEMNYETVKTDYILKVSGDSMQPIYNDGDFIMIKYTPFVEIDEIGIFLINNESFVKKFGGDRLISLNKNYDDIMLNEYQDIRCQGKVIGILNKDWIRR